MVANSHYQSSSGGPKRRQAELHNHIGKKKPMNCFSHGCHGQQYCSWVCTHDDDGGVAQHGSHTPNNWLIETCSLGLPCTSLILDIHVMTNWHLSKQGICWRVFLKFTADQMLDWIAGLCQVNFPGLKFIRIIFITFSSIQMFFPLRFVFTKLKTENLTAKVPEHKSKLYLFLG